MDVIKTPDPAPQDPLLLQNQLCFPLYVCSKEIIKRYKPLLDALDLTYTQYIAMMVLWEERTLTAKALGERLWLDSGTLTPLLKKLEQKRYITRARSAEDERNLMVALTAEGAALRARAVDVPAAVGKCVNLSPAEAAQLYELLYRLLGSL